MQRNALRNHRFIFIGGLHRSGTSLLFKILRAHPAISGFHNTGVPEDEGAHLQSVYTAPKYLGRAGFFALHPNAHQTDTSHLVTDSNRARLWGAWQPYWDTNASYLLEKSPANTLLTRFLQAMFPHSYFIIMTRHPIAVTLATRKWFSRRDIRHYRLDRMTENWVVAHETLQQDIPHLKRVLIVRYEDLASNPSAILQQIYTFLELPAEPTNEVIHANINDTYFNAWQQLKRHFLYSMLIRYVEMRYSGRIRQLGYNFRVFAHSLR